MSTKEVQFRLSSYLAMQANIATSQLLRPEGRGLLGDRRAQVAFLKEGGFLAEKIN